MLGLFFLSSCTALVFQPTHRLYYDPETTLHVTPDDFYISVTKDINLHAWRFKSKEKTKGVVVQFHGNAENISSHYVSVAWLLNYGYDVISFDYRGYGLSNGISAFPTVVNDAVIVMDFVYNQYKDQNLPLIVYGQSLGSMIATNTIVRSNVKVSEVILEGGIYSLNNVSADVLSKKWFTWPFQGLGYVLMSHHYNFNKIKDQFPKIPVLLLHSKHDPIIDPRQSEKLHKDIAGSCLKLVDEATHIGIGNLEKGKYRPEILRFLETSQCIN